MLLDIYLLILMSLLLVTVAVVSENYVIYYCYHYNNYE